MPKLEIFRRENESNHTQESQPVRIFRENSEMHVFHSGDFAVTVNKSGEITSASQSFGEIFQCAPDEVVGQQFVNFIFDDPEFFTQLLESPNSNGDEISLILKSKGENDRRSIQFVILPCKEVENEFVLRGRDNTEALLMERAVEILLITVMHDFGNAIQHNVLHLNSLQKDMEKSPKKLNPENALRQLKKDTKRLQKLLKVASAQMSVQFDRFALKPIKSHEMKDLLESVFEDIDEHSGVKGINEFSKIPDIYGDDALISTLFTNLISNAVKYAHPERISEGTAFVKVSMGEVANGYATFYVSDNGLGIPQESQSKVFSFGERFHSKHTQGTGIGLWLVNQIVQRLGGEITFESAEGVGTTFIIHIPTKAS